MVGVDPEIYLGGGGVGGGGGSKRFNASTLNDASHWEARS